MYGDYSGSGPQVDDAVRFKPAKGNQEQQGWYYCRGRHTEKYHTVGQLALTRSLYLKLLYLHEVYGYLGDSHCRKFHHPMAQVSPAGSFRP
jgi:hypothetical protein